MSIIEVDWLTPKEVENYPYLRETFRNTFPLAREQDIDKMVSIAVGICPNCWQEKRDGCYCMAND